MDPIVNVGQAASKRLMLVLNHPEIGDDDVAFDSKALLQLDGSCLELLKVSEHELLDLARV